MEGLRLRVRMRVWRKVVVAVVEDVLLRAVVHVSWGGCDVM